MHFEIINSRTRQIRIPAFNVTGTEFVLRTLPIPDNLDYAEIYQHIHHLFDGSCILFSLFAYQIQSLHNALYKKEAIFGF